MKNTEAPGRTTAKLRWFTRILGFRDYIESQIILTEQDIDLWEQETGERDPRQEEMLVLFREQLREIERRIAETRWAPRMPKPSK